MPGRVLATGTPAGLVAARGAASLEEAFIGYLEEAAGERPRPADASPTPAPAEPERRRARPPRRSACGGCSPIAIREEPGAAARPDPARLRPARHRDPDAGLRLRHHHGRGDLTFAALDRDQTPESRAYLEELAGSRYFVEQPADRRLRRARAAAAQRRARGWPSRSRPASAATCSARPAGRGRRPGSTAPCRSAPRRSGATSRACTRHYLADPRGAARRRRRGRRRRSRSGSATTRTSRACMPWCRAIIAHAAGPDPRHPDGARRGAREGAGLDHQLLRHARDPRSSSCSASSCPTSPGDAQLPRCWSAWRCSSSACR